MQGFVKGVTKDLAATAQDPRSFKGVGSTHGFDSYMFKHNREVRVAHAKGPLCPNQGSSNLFGADSYMLQQVKDWKDNEAERVSTFNHRLTSTLEADSVLTRFAKQQTWQQRSPPVRSRLDIVGAARPNLPAEGPILFASPVRSTAASTTVPPSQTPVRAGPVGRPFGAETRPSIPADSFMMAHLKSLVAWSPNKGRAREVRI